MHCLVYSQPSTWFGGLDVRVTCPKCKSENARYIKDYQDVTLRCMCGFNRVVASKLGEMTIEHIDSEEDVSLPRKGSNLWNTFTALAALQQATTQQVTEHVNSIFSTSHTSSDISTQLTILRYKRIVVTLDNKRGTAGGSTWVLTGAAKRLLGVT